MALAETLLLARAENVWYSFLNKHIEVSELRINFHALKNKMAVNEKRHFRTIDEALDSF